MKVKSQAKVNLTFDILSVLPDGFHEVSTLMQAIDLGDTLSFAISPGQKFNVEIVLLQGKDRKQFPLDDTNLIYRSAKAFADCLVTDSFSLVVQVDKNIPIAAGLAGGSSNAAATLLVLNEFFNRPLNKQALTDLARALGADVPFCLSGGTAIGLGRGDILKQVESALKFNFCLVKPKDIFLATPWVYQQYDLYVAEKGTTSIKRPNLENAVGALSFGELDAAIEAFGNVFEPVVYAHYPELLELKQQLAGYGCPYVQLTGSGPTIFALTSDLEMAHFVRSKLVSSANSEKLDVFLAGSVKDGLLARGNAHAN